MAYILPYQEGHIGVLSRGTVRVAVSALSSTPVCRNKEVLKVRKAEYDSSNLSVAREIREEEKFIQAWTQGTAAIRAKVIGAGGSLLMRSHHDRSEFMALACWNSIEDWQAFAAENDSAPPDPEAFRVMGAVSEHLCTEILEEVADLLDCGPC